MIERKERQKIADQIIELTHFDMYDFSITTFGVGPFFEMISMCNLVSILDDVMEKGSSPMLEERFRYKLKNALGFGGFVEVYGDKNRVVYKNEKTNEWIEIRRW